MGDYQQTKWERLWKYISYTFKFNLLFPAHPEPQSNRLRHEIRPYWCENMRSLSTVDFGSKSLPWRPPLHSNLRSIPWHPVLKLSCHWVCSNYYVDKLLLDIFSFAGILRLLITVVFVTDLFFFPSGPTYCSQWSGPRSRGLQQLRSPPSLWSEVIECVSDRFLCRFGSCLAFLKRRASKAPLSRCAMVSSQQSRTGLALWLNKECYDLWPVGSRSGYGLPTR